MFKRTLKYPVCQLYQYICQQFKSSKSDCIINQKINRRCDLILKFKAFLQKGSNGSDYWQLDYFCWSGHLFASVCRWNRRWNHFLFVQETLRLSWGIDGGCVYMYPKFAWGLRGCWLCSHTWFVLWGLLGFQKSCFLFHFIKDSFFYVGSCRE